MNSGKIMIIIGIGLVVSGFIAFYSMNDAPLEKIETRLIKHGGTFFGMLGIGVCIAGFILYVTNRPRQNPGTLEI